MPLSIEDAAVERRCRFRMEKRLRQPVPAKRIHVAADSARPPRIERLRTVYVGLNSSQCDDSYLTEDSRSLITIQGILSLRLR